ncbi:MAG TPA: RodZ domain-containing protein [Rhodopila sp.]|nr:RodZ domain-containing protein [Rhodopila sp.]
MPRDQESRTYALQAVSVALMVALAGCASPSNTPLITDSIRTQLAQAMPAGGTATDNPETGKPATPPDALTHASGLVAAGRIDEGITEAKLAFALHPNDMAMGLEVGRLAVRAGRLADALDIYQKIKEQHPNSPEPLNGQGVVLAEQGDLTGAMEAFHKALALRPQDVPARSNLALALLLSGSTSAALPILEDLAHTGDSPQVEAALKIARRRVKGEDNRLAARTSVPPAPKPAAAPATAAQMAPKQMAPTQMAPTPATWNTGEHHIMLHARDTAWMRVRDHSGRIWLSRELHPGETWPVPNVPGLLFSTGNAGATDIIVDGTTVAPLGRVGEVIRDVPLDAEAIKQGKLPTQPHTAQLQGDVVPG